MKQASVVIDKEAIFEEACRVLDIEAEAVSLMKKAINDEFVAIVELIAHCAGRLVVTGIGKSGHIANKLAATFASTGTPSFFLHPAEGVHGDLGMVTEDDVVLALSNSGETREILALMPSIKRIGAKVVAMTGNPASSLAQVADHVLLCAVEKEACPLGLAPTASSTAVLALGDALAMALLKVKNFSPEEFAIFHPGGALGRRLLLRMSDVMSVRGQNPVVKENQTVEEALFMMTSTRMGAVSVVNDAGVLVGIITDGDIRRSLRAKRTNKILEQPASAVMTRRPTTITSNELAAKAVKIMEAKEISDLPVVDSENRPIGMVNMQDILKAGVI